MAEKSAISWTEATWNPWMGCERVSLGCEKCYMFREMSRYGKWDPSIVRRSKTTFGNPLKWKEPKLIFTCSWSDWFHKDADEWRDEAWEIIRQTPHHTYQILTKRHGRIRNHLPSYWPLRNVWLGVTAEDNDTFWRRARVLSTIPDVAVRFISSEPLLGPIQVTTDELAELNIDWLIAGGESGPDARPMDIEWAKQLRNACVAAGVPFFLKQLGGYPDKQADEKAVLDGQTWTQMPAEFTPPQLDLL